MYNDMIKLAKTEYTQDEYLNTLEKEIDWENAKSVMCETKSITQSEFYAAQQSIYNPQIKFKISDAYDYDGEDRILYSGTVYKVVRTYGTRWLEIVAELARPGN